MRLITVYVFALSEKVPYYATFIFQKVSVQFSESVS